MPCRTPLLLTAYLLLLLCPLGGGVVAPDPPLRAGPNHRLDRVLVVRKPGARTAQASSSFKPLGLRGLGTAAVGEGESVAAAVARLSLDPGVLLAEPDYMVQAAALPPGGPRRWAAQWGLRRTSAPGAWDVASGSGHNVTVCIIDTGVDVSHPDLAAHLPLGPDGGWNAIDPSLPPLDDNGEMFFLFF